MKKNIVLLFLVIAGITLSACGNKSLSDTLVSGSGSWSAVSSEGESWEVTFFNDGKAVVSESGKSSNTGNYVVEDSDIKFLNDKSEVTTTFSDAKVDGKSIKATLYNFKAENGVSITLTSIE